VKSPVVAQLGYGQGPEAPLLASYLKPRPTITVVRRADGGMEHLAVGLWVATLIVLFAPNPRGSAKSKLTEDHLLRAYGGIVLPAFAFV